MFKFIYIKLYQMIKFQISFEVKISHFKFLIYLDFNVSFIDKI